MTTGYRILSRHLLRRTARAKARRITRRARAAGTPFVSITVIRAPRGPWRWYVIRPRNSA